MSLELKERTVLQATIQSLVGISPAALVNASNQVKAYWTRVPENIPLPYLIYSRMPVGGLRNTPHAQDSDSLWRIVVNTANWADIDAYDEFVGKLHRLDPVIPALAGFDGVVPVSYLEEHSPVTATTQPQNTTVFEVGGIYRLRLYFGETEV
jgi:hypothetical protein